LHTPGPERPNTIFVWQTPKNTGLSNVVAYATSGGAPRRIPWPRARVHFYAVLVPRLQIEIVGNETLGVQLAVCCRLHRGNFCILGNTESGVAMIR